MRKYISIIIPVILFSGCTSLSKDVKLVTQSSEPATVLIYRESAFQAGAASLLIGRNSKYFVALRNNQYTSFQIDPGTHIIQAKADGAPASSFEIKLEKNQRLCLKGKPNPKMLGAVVIPIIANMVPTFVFENSECPDEKELSSYVKVNKL